MTNMDNWPLAPRSQYPVMIISQCFPTFLINMLLSTILNSADKRWCTSSAGIYPAERKPRQTLKFWKVKMTSTDTLATSASMCMVSQSSSLNLFHIKTSTLNLCTLQLSIIWRHIFCVWWQFCVKKSRYLFVKKKKIVKWLSRPHFLCVQSSNVAASAFFKSKLQEGIC